MKHIERYLSAYVMASLFGHTDPEEFEYVCLTLERSSSHTDHPVLNSVLDIIRQDNPRNPKVIQEVADYVRALTNHTTSPADIKPKSDWSARFHVADGFAAFLVLNSKEKSGNIVMTEANNVDEYCKKLQEEHPGITIKQV